MPWQQYVVDVALEMVRDPATGLLVPAYREPIVTVMRQCGKSTLVLAMLVDRALNWDDPQAMVYTAQTAQEARRKLLRDWVPILRRSPLTKAVKNVRQQSGSEAIYWRNGSGIEVIPRDGSAGHGRTLDVAVIDEAFDDVDDRGEGAMGPGMVTRIAAQKWVLSTMGTDLSHYLNRKVEMGRQAVAEGLRTGIAYFEWAIPDNEDVYDHDVWAQYNPALGHTITASVLQAEAESVSEAEFRRAYGNQQTRSADDGPFASETWRNVCEDGAQPLGDLRFGLDMMSDRSASAIVAFGSGVGELLETRPGVEWVIPRMAEIAHMHRGVVVIQSMGPAAYVADELEKQHIKVERLGEPEFAGACARIYDAVVAGAIKVRTSGPLTEAVKHVRKRPVGDRFAWSRSASGGDVSPFVALTLAYGGTHTKREPLIRTGR